MDIPVGIVVYNPEITRLVENVNSVYDNAAEIIIVDNGSKNSNAVMQFVRKYEKIQYISNEKNLGIASALNILCLKAYEGGYEWIITLDQDSVCPPNIFEEYSKHINKKNVGILCPAINDRNCALDVIKGENIVSRVRSCITSASLVRLDAWRKVNGFDESMFIDGVDFDFCDRVISYGYEILKIHSVVLLHEIGHIEIRKFLFWNVRVKNHSAFRKYYIARNTIVLARKRKKIVLLIKSVLQVIKQYFVVLLYEKSKQEKMIEIARGLIDGFLFNIEDKWRY